MHYYERKKITPKTEPNQVWFGFFFFGIQLLYLEKTKKKSISLDWFFIRKTHIKAEACYARTGKEIII